MRPTNTNTQEVERQIEGQGEQSAEQAAELAALQALAGPVPGQEEGEGEGEQEAAIVPDLAQEIEGLVQAAVGMLAPLFPSLQGIYTPEATKAAAAATAAVCSKHGWMQGGMMGRWGEEITCAIIVGPLAFATYHGVKADIAARQPAEPSRSGELNLSAPVPTAPGTGKGVTFGAPVPVGEAAAA